VVIWYIFPRFGILDQEKSGNPANSHQACLLLTWFLTVMATPLMFLWPHLFGTVLTSDCYEN
jgi:hypothetical protein